MPHWTFYRRTGNPRDLSSNGWEELSRGSREYGLVAREIPRLDRDGSHVRSCELPFYGRPSRLCEAIVDGDAVPRYVVVHAGDDPVVCTLDGKPSTILTLNRRLQIRLDPTNACDYLYFWLSHHDSEGRRVQPVERLDQVRWRVRSRPGEEHLLARHLKSIVPKPFRSTGTIELKPRVLCGSTLYASTYSVSAHGHVMLASQAQPLLWSLPVVDDLLADSAGSQPEFYAGTWDDCEDAAAVPDVLARMVAALPAKAEAPAKLLSRSVGFFPGARLYRGIYEDTAPEDLPKDVREARADDDTPVRPREADDPAGSGLFVLKGAADLYLLDGSSRPIFDAIDREPFTLARGKSALDEALVLEYLGFFCRVLHGPEGPFYLLEELSDLNVVRAPRTRRRRRAEGQARHYDALQLDEIAAFTRPLQVSSLEPHEALADCCMQFGGALYGTQIRVWPDGQVWMAEELPAISGLPANWVRNTSPLRRRPAAAG